jgi:DNA-binding transcriptional LysR family regulator
VKQKQLDTFLAVVDAGSIHAGARALGTSQPAVSMIIRDLERLLGAPLFRRSSLGIELTEYGQTFSIRARALVEDMRRAKSEIAQMQNGESGRVTIALSSTAARVFLPAALARFQRTMPNVTVELNDATWLEALEQLRKGVIDFALVQAPPTLTYPDTVHVTPLVALPLIVGARVGHPLIERRSLGDLVDAAWLLPGRPAPGSAERFADLFERHGFRPPRRIMRCQSTLTAFALMQDMDLISLFAEPMVAQEFSRYGLKAIRVKEPMPNLMHSLLTRPESPLTTAAKYFFECFERTRPAEGRTKRHP